MNSSDESFYSVMCVQDQESNSETNDMPLSQAGQVAGTVPKEARPD